MATKAPARRIANGAQRLVLGLRALIAPSSPLQHWLRARYANHIAHHSRVHTADNMGAAQAAWQVSARHALQ